jgi:eukaryotic-like serine/threonine-protein kinase
LRGPIPFGRHLLLERIAVGGMAEVFRAKAFGAEGFERIVAVKKILASMAEDEEFIKMFIDEARIVSYLTHQNIVQIYEFGKHEVVYYISMEYVAGRDLRTILDRQKRLKKPVDAGMACYVIGRVCEALDYAHRKRDPTGKDYKIIHRDVSPQNVIISYEGEVKLCDFGIAKAVTQSTRTQVGVLKGKFAYMSPEQVRGRPIDRRSDLFALGVIFYEMVTGERLFLGDSDYSTLEAVRAAKVPPPRTFNPTIAPRLEEILLKLLTREPEHRYQWASEVLEDLHSFLVSAGLVYHAHNLRQFMQEAYDREIATENAKLEAFMNLKMPDASKAVSKPEERAKSSAEMLSFPPATPPPRALTTPDRPDDDETYEGPNEQLEVSGTAIDPQLIALAHNKGAPPPVPNDSRAALAGAHDDLSATVMSDERQDEPGATVESEAKQGDALQAEIQAAQAALLERLEAMMGGDEGIKKPVTPKPHLIPRSPSATPLETADIEPNRPIEDPAEDDAGRTSEWGAPPDFGTNGASAEPKKTSETSEPRRSPEPSGPNRLIREKRRDPSSDPALAPATPRTPVAAIAHLPQATAPMAGAQGGRDPRIFAIGAVAAVLLTLTLTIVVFVTRRPSHPSLHIETTPTTSVEVYLDGELLQTGTPVDVERIAIGEHTVEVRAKGFHIYRQTFPISEARPHTLTIPLETESPEPKKPKPEARR